MVFSHKLAIKYNLIFNNDSYKICKTYNFKKNINIKIKIIRKSYKLDDIIISFEIITLQ